MTITEQHKILSEIFLKCSKNDSLKQHFKSTPKIVLVEHGFDVPDDIEIKVVENTDRKVYITLPAHPGMQDELSYSDLQTAPCIFGMCKPKGSTGN